MNNTTIAYLQDRARRLTINSLAPSTYSKYSSYFNTYTEFCHLLNLPSLPLSQNTLILFATHLSPTHSHKHITAHISAIKFSAELAGLDTNNLPLDRLYRVVRGIKRTQGKTFKRPKRIPITPPLLNQLGMNLWNSSLKFHDKTMLWAAMLTAFHGFLRISEYTSPRIRQFNPHTTLMFSDLVTLSPNNIALHIKASKTDPFRQGTTVQLFRNNSPLCPVNALLHYIHSHHSGSGPLFVWQDGRFLTRSGFASALNKIKPPHLQHMSSHSFRIGAATTAAAAGHPRWLIQALGRWSSNCYQDYIRIPKNTLHTVSHSLARHWSVTSQPFDPDNITN